MTRAVTKALKDVGARLKRQKKHLVYELPSGRNIVVAKTPSDRAHGEQNALREIRVAAGVAKPKPPTTAKPRRPKPGRHEAPWSLPVKTSLANVIQKAGVVEQQLREQIERMETEAALQAAHIASLTAERDMLRLELQAKRTIWQRLRPWVVTFVEVMRR